jgi:ribonuclease BN (tRNA processing enzyme)
MDIRILGAHNCESRSSKYTSLLIDDTLAIDAGGLTSSLSFEAQRKLKTILLTHQHYDHIRDIPVIAMNLYIQEKTIKIYSTQPVYDVLSGYLLDGKLYPKFLEWPGQEPTVKFTIIQPDKPEYIAGYHILAVPVNHSVPAVGYEITSPDGKIVFYTGDTGPGLTNCWQSISPQLILFELTAPNKYEEFARQAGHLTPSLLAQELVSFRELKGYLPQVILVHINPDLEKDINNEVATIAQDLEHPITLGYEGMRLQL